MLDRAGAFALGMTDEVEHERHGRGRVRSQELVAGVENVGFHLRQCLHPGRTSARSEERPTIRLVSLALCTRLHRTDPGNHTNASSATFSRRAYLSNPRM